MSNEQELRRASAYRAVDAAFEQHVALLFRVLCEGEIADAGGAGERFTRGFEIALRAREKARAVVERTIA